MKNAGIIQDYLTYIIILSKIYNISIIYFRTGCIRYENNALAWIWALPGEGYIKIYRP